MQKKQALLTKNEKGEATNEDIGSNAASFKACDQGIGKKCLLR